MMSNVNGSTRHFDGAIRKMNFIQKLPRLRNLDAMREVKEILKEKVYSKQQALAVSEYACSSAERFAKLMQCFLSNEYRLAQRAAWSVSWAARQKPDLIEPHIKDLVAQLPRKDVHDAVIRNSVRILQEIEIPESLH